MIRKRWLRPEFRQTVETWNKTDAPYPHTRCLHDLFLGQANQTPDQTAVLFEDDNEETHSLSYKELFQAAGRLASHLQEQGVQPDDIVAIALDRTPELVIAVLGVLMAGGAYAPVDPRYPKERIAFMLENSKASNILTTSRIAGKLPDFDGAVFLFDKNYEELTIDIDSRQEHDVSPDNLAYVIYTSGSTGTPKGVAMEHRPLVNLIHWQNQRSTMATGDRTLQFSSLSFDVSCQEMFSTLSSGGTLVLVSETIRRDAAALLRFIERHSINRIFLPFVALQGLAEAGYGLRLFPRSLREVITAGEQLQINRYIRSFFKSMPWCSLDNQYGPSESHVVTAYMVPPSSLDTQQLPPIGKPIANARIYILDEKKIPVQPGETGELYIGGVSLARGYLYRPDLTERAFIPDPFTDIPGSRLYRTGDLARYLSDGNIEFLGRIDHQVKIRGFRVEIGEIETILSGHEAIRQAVVVALDDGDEGHRRLVAYITTENNRQVPGNVLRSYLKTKLPSYMIPALFVQIEQFPKTPSGKIDRKSLPRPFGQRPLLEQAYIAPRTPVEKELARLWRKVLHVDKVGIRDNFFELGGDSLLAQELAVRIQKTFDLADLAVVKLFQYSTVEELAGYIESLERSGPQQGARISFHERRKRPIDGSGKVAIIGMACRLPGADNIDELWKNLESGVESVTFFRDEELDPSIDAATRQQKRYVKARGIIRDIDMFDAGFFGIGPREAEMLDPQHRIFLELAWTALEHAGYVPDTYPGRIGIYAGAGVNTYYLNNVLSRPDLVRQYGEFQAMVANEKDYLTTRIAHRLGLTGPAINLYTACSTSLVAVSEAYFSLITGQCEMALAGGISISVPQNSGYLYQEGGMLSADGHCRPFDAAGTGTIFGNGAGIVVLKPLEEALADHDTIYAILCGAATNNDGASKVSFAAPSVTGQAEAIVMAQQRAGFDPETISYIEAHGTATPLGDPIEIEALTQAFRLHTQKRQFCAIGSIKSNFGHAIAAAGVAGLIKTVQALYHKSIPPTLHFSSPNPHINFSDSPFFVVKEHTLWKRGEAPRRAGVSSFGLGGTNAHVVLEEAPEPPKEEATRGTDPAHLLLLSAKTKETLAKMASNLSRFLRQRPDTDLGDVAFTLQMGRKGFNHRMFFVCRELEDVVTRLDRKDSFRPALVEQSDPPVSFMFPGQGAQHVGMGQELYASDETFRGVLDEGAELLKEVLDTDIRTLLFSDSGEQDDRLKQTAIAQPALFLVEYGLVQAWDALGVRPQSMIGHSIGELTAACVAGVFSFADGVRIVARRGALMQQCPSGSMLSVRMAAEKVEKLLPDGLVVATVNAPELCVVSGGSEAIESFRRYLEKEEVTCRLLHTSHAFHSASMEPAAREFASFMRTQPLSPPSIPFISCVSGTWITEKQAIDPEYWGEQIRRPVRFSDGMEKILAEETILLETGPRATMSMLARQHASAKGRTILSSLDQKGSREKEYGSWLTACGRLWQNGLEVNWPVLHRGKQRGRIPLPTYPFARERFWIDPPASGPREVVGGEVCCAVVASDETVREKEDMVPVKERENALQEAVIGKLVETIEEASGISIGKESIDQAFLDLGFDSLLLTQMATNIANTFSVEVTFRQLMEEFDSVSVLAAYIMEHAQGLDGMVKTEKTASSEPDMAPSGLAARQARICHESSDAGPKQGRSMGGQGLEGLLMQQLEIIQRQLDMISGSITVPPASPAIAGAKEGKEDLFAAGSGERPSPQTVSSDRKDSDAVTRRSQQAFGPSARISTRSETQLSEHQQRHLQGLVERYTKKTAGSREYTQRHRAHLADPRAVSGFRPLFKELIYPIVVKSSNGVRLVDIDGNEYVDMINGFGSNFFGFTNPMIMEAVAEQMQRGVEIGPQHPLAGEVAELLAELTGLERFAFCNTGSEAVLGCMRLARTVTGRKTIVMFRGAYHGIFDEVIVRGTPSLRSFPAAPGIMPEAVQNTLVLEYGSDDALKVIRERGGEIAAVLVEPVQSRKPSLQPVEFLRKLRALTEECGAALIMDEVITGFRIDPGGAQAYFGIRADLATYGKVIGGGLPIGVIGGASRFMDALDGGFWQYGDTSFPEAGVTYFAGTFVRHPMALAAAKRVLTYLKEQGKELQKRLNHRAERFVRTLNEIFRLTGAPLAITHFGSLMKLEFTGEDPLYELFYVFMREKGVHIWDGRPIFLTLAHTDDDLALVEKAIRESIAGMQAAGFFPKALEQSVQTDDEDQGGIPPVPGARLGRTPDGHAAWFIEDPERPGKYIQLEE